MSIAVTVEDTVNDAIKFLLENKQVTFKAAKAAINRTIVGARAEASKGIRERYKLKAGDVKGDLYMSKAKQRKIDDLQAVLTPSSHGISLAKFTNKRRLDQALKPVKKRPKLKATIVPGKRLTLKKSWIMTTKGGVGVFRRMGKGRSAHIQFQSVPSLSALFKKGIQADVETYSKARLGREFTSAYEALLEKQSVAE